MNASRRSCRLTILLVVLLWSGQAAGAPPRPSYDQLRQQGTACYRARDYRCALQKFEAAYSQKPTAEMRFNIASAQDKLGYAALAVREFRRYLEEAGPAAQPQALLHIQSRLEALLEQVARLRLELQPADAKLALNGAPVALQQEPLVEGRRELVLEPGPYRLQLSAPGHEPATRDISLARGELRQLALALQPAPDQRGGLALESQPTGAQIKIDGRLLEATTPARIAELAPGWHTVELATGSQTHRARVLIEPGRQAALSVELHLAVVELLLTSEPPGARVMLDGRDLGQTPLLVAALAAGEHTLVWEKDGYQRQLQPLTITGWSPTRLQLDQRLEPLPAAAAPGLAQAVEPLLSSEQPPESGVLRAGAALTFGVGSDEVTAYRFGLEGSYLLTRRLQLGLNLPLIVHGLTVVDGQVQEASAFGNLVFKLKLGLTSPEGRRLALAAYAHLLAPTISVEVPSRAFFGLRAGAAVTAQLGAVSLNADAGGQGMIYNEAEDTWVVLANGHAAVRLHRYVALGLALQLAAYLQPLFAQPALSLTPQLTLLPTPRLSASLGVRVALTEVGRVYTLYTPAVFLLTVGYGF